VQAHSYAKLLLRHFSPSSNAKEEVKGVLDDVAKVAHPASVGPVRIVRIAICWSQILRVESSHFGILERFRVMLSNMEYSSDKSGHFGGWVLSLLVAGFEQGRCWLSSSFAHNCV
jgi:hypothetical protein